MRTGIIRKMACGAVVIAASAMMCSCGGWWVGSNGWGITQPGPGGINIGISGGWNNIAPDPGLLPVPRWADRTDPVDPVDLLHPLTVLIKK